MAMDERITTAAREQDCHACDRKIKAGDLIAHAGIHGWVHERCAARVRPADLSRRVARYGQECGACRKWISPGEIIAADPRGTLGWVHTGCVSR